MKEPGLITRYLADKGTGIIALESEVSDSTDQYLAFDDGGVEVELGEFLYGLVKVLQPDRVLETGTYSGISGMYIGQALKENGHGLLLSLEYEERHIERARKLWQQIKVSKQIVSVRGSSLDFVPQDSYQLIFLDSEPNIRWAELESFYPYLAKGGFIGIHDCPRTMCQGNSNPDHPTISSWPFGDIPTNMKRWIKEGKLVKFHLPNPRGSVWFYRPHQEDYQP